MPFKRIGEIPFNAGNIGEPVTIRNPEAITGFYALLIGQITTLAGGGTVVTVAEAVKKVIRQITILRGGAALQTWGVDSPFGSGGTILEVVNRVYLRTVPKQDIPAALTAAPGTGVADATYNFSYGFRIPFSLPPNRYPKSLVNRSALRIQERTWQLNCKWGVASDLALAAGAGTVTVDSLTLVVAPIIDRSLSPKWPANGFAMFTIPDPKVLERSANPALDHELSKNGDVIAHAIVAYDNDLLSDTIINQLTYLVNDDLTVAFGEWELFQLDAEDDGDNARDTGLPNGFNFANFDRDGDLTQRIITTRAAGWKTQIDQNAGAAAPATNTLIQQVMYLRSLEAVLR